MMMMSAGPLGTKPEKLLLLISFSLTGKRWERKKNVWLLLQRKERRWRRRSWHLCGESFFIFIIIFAVTLL
jgi:hypothetical protein